MEIKSVFRDAASYRHKPNRRNFIFFFVRLVGVKRSFVQRYKENPISTNILSFFRTVDYQTRHIHRYFLANGFVHANWLFFDWSASWIVAFVLAYRPPVAFSTLDIP